MWLVGFPIVCQSNSVKRCRRLKPICKLTLEDSIFLLSFTRGPSLPTRCFVPFAWLQCLWFIIGVTLSSSIAPWCCVVSCPRLSLARPKHKLTWPTRTSIHSASCQPVAKQDTLRSNLPSPGLQAGVASLPCVLGDTGHVVGTPPQPPVELGKVGSKAPDAIGNFGGADGSRKIKMKTKLCPCACFAKCGRKFIILPCMFTFAYSG